MSGARVTEVSQGGSCTAAGPDPATVRQKLGLSQSEFAALLGISTRTLQNWEQGHRQPTGAALQLLRVAEQFPREVLAAVHETGKR